MKALVIFHSQTGHTAKFADGIAKILSDNGNDVDLHVLDTTAPLAKNHSPLDTSFTLKPIPNLQQYDLICLGTPIWAFNPAPLSVKFLQTIDSLKGKKFMSFITMGFPFKFLGGKGSLAKLNKLAQAKGASIEKGSIITYMKSDPDAQMKIELERIKTLFR